MKKNKFMFMTVLAVGGLGWWSEALWANDPAGQATAASFAGVPPHGQPSHAAFERLAEQLKLSDKQRPQVEAAMAAEAGQMQGLIQQTGLAAGERNAKIKAIHQDTAAQMEAALTPGQFRQWQALQSRMRAPRTGLHAKAPGSARMPASVHFSGLAADLNLTTDQRSKVKAIKDAEMKKIYNVRQQQPITIEIRRVKMRHIHEETAAQLKTVLTAEQWKKGLAKGVPEIIGP